jgi:hypothetical protein
MADIKQAAEWMKEGKQVWRGRNLGDNMPSTIKQSTTIVLDDNGVVVGGIGEYPVMMTIFALLADDWEVVE